MNAEHQSPTQGTDLNRRHGCLICIVTALGTIMLFGAASALLVLFW